MGTHSTATLVPHRPTVPPRRGALALALSLAALLAAGCFHPPAPPLETRLGRSEVRVWSAPYPIAAGARVRQSGLPERLRRLGYTRVRSKPEAPGEYFWGSDVMWIYRRGHRWSGRDWPARLLRLDLEPRDGTIRAVRGSPRGFFLLAHEEGLWLEPEVLAEALDGRTAPRLPVRLDDLPEHVWRPILAAEDHRFFSHFGIDPRGLLRAALQNVRAGHVAQGGSTLTQQMVKNRDLTSERSVGRKVSEAWRALEVEREHSKQEILEVYLNHVYLGQVDGLAVHGFGAGAAAYFGKQARDLQVQEAATLAGMIRSPNRLSPLRHPAEAKTRRDQVLGLMAQYGWLTPAAAALAQSRPLGLHPLAPRPPMAGSFLGWAAAVAQRTAPDRIAAGRGVVLETTLDPLLQSWAESTVITSVGRLRRLHPELRRAPLGVALVALDADSGDVLAYVGSPPGSLPGGFDRARQGQRQPGSLVKPLVLLEAFERCGGEPLFPASRVADEPLQWTLPRGEVWQPVDADRRYEGVITVREALRESRNVPFVRIARRCGLADTAARVRAAGLPLPDPAPPSFVLGAVEETPLAVARAYTVFATPGDALAPRPVTRVEKPGGARLDRVWVRRREVVSPASAYLVIDLLRDAAQRGTASAAAVPGLVVAAKTGTTSESRDAWLAGHAGGLVTVVWVGRDDGQPLGLTGSQAAAPLWRDFMRLAVGLRPPRHLGRPDGVVDRWVDDESGLLVGDGDDHAHVDVFREEALPPRHRWWRPDPDVPVVR